METQLTVWAGKIDEFTAAAQESNGWARIGLRQRVDDLKIKRALVRANLDELKAAGRDSRAGCLSKNEALRPDDSKERDRCGTD
jgi:hypothetical protein